MTMSCDCSSHKDFSQELLFFNQEWLEKCPIENYYKITELLCMLSLVDRCV